MHCGAALQWWALSDLNGRPFGCKPNALTAELSALTQVIVQEAASSVNGLRDVPSRRGLLCNELFFSDVEKICVEIHGRLNAILNAFICFAAGGSFVWDRPAGIIRYF